MILEDVYITISLTWFPMADAVNTVVCLFCFFLTCVYFGIVFLYKSDNKLSQFFT